MLLTAYSLILILHGTTKGLVHYTVLTQVCSVSLVTQGYWMCTDCKAAGCGFLFQFYDNHV